MTIIKKIMIIGGCRAYLDAFSDYMNPLLIEMDKAEKMFSNMNVKNKLKNKKSTVFHNLRNIMK